MIVPNREIATGEASELVLNSLPKVVLAATSAERQIAEAVVPLFGIRRNAQAIRRVGERGLTDPDAPSKLQTRRTAI